MKKQIVLAVIGGMAASSAFAADAILYNEPSYSPPPMDAPQASVDWTGVQVGVQAGYGWARAENGPVTAKGDGFLGGGYASYNHDFGDIVVGGEVDADFARVKFDNSSARIDRAARAKARVGYDFGNAMLYGTGGVAYARIKNTATNTRSDDIGYVAGAGVDFAATDNIVVGTEYLYHRFSDFDNSTDKLTGHTVKAKAGVKF
jgi:outer membrane immunogenic protein